MPPVAIYLSYSTPKRVLAYVGMRFFAWYMTKWREGARMEGGHPVSS